MHDEAKETGEIERVIDKLQSYAKHLVLADMRNSTNNQMDINNGAASSTTTAIGGNS